MTDIRAILKINKAICLSLLLAGLTVAFPAFAEEDKEDDPKDVEYSGVYEERQIIPNSLAIFCKTDAETMVIEQMTKNERTEEEKAKASALKKCLDKIISQISHKEAITRSEGIKEYQIILQDQRAQMMAEAVSKSAIISSYSKEKQDTQAAVGEQQTNFEDTAGLGNVESKLTDIISTTRDLLSEEAKYFALEGLALVDANVIVTAEEEKDESKEAGKDEHNVTMNIQETHVEAEEEAPKDQASEANTSDDMVDGDDDAGVVEDPNVEDNTTGEGEQETEKYAKEKVKGEYDPETGQCKVRGKLKPCEDGLYTNGDKTMICFADGTCNEYEEW